MIIPPSAYRVRTGVIARTAIAVARRPVAAVTAVTAVKPIATIAAVKAVTAAIVAVAVAFGPAHHGRGAGLVFLDPDGQVAQHVLIETLQALDFVDRRRRRIDVHQREMCLAVLAQPVGERFHAPIFGLGDRSAEAFDDAL